MLLILINWMYCLFITVGVGSFSSFLLRKNYHLFYQILVGLFIETIIIHVYAIFFPINLAFYALNSALALCGVYLHSSNLKQQINKTLNVIKNWAYEYKILLFVLGVMTLMQSASIPYIPDNESYYIQSTRWLNTFGLVKGLANLHIFLAQMSGWHVLQSGFNVGFFSNKLNDLNGFLMFITSSYFVHKLVTFSKTKKKEDLFLGLIFIGNLFLYQFVNTPSPDLPIFLVSQIIFYLFYLNFKTYKGDFRLIFMLTLWLILIKITIFPILFLPICLCLKHKLLKKEVLFFSLFSLLSLSVFMVKNYIISGYPLYPLELFGNYINADWKVPKNLQNLYYTFTKMTAFTQIMIEEYEQMSTWQIFKIWLFEPKLRTLFNVLVVILLLVFPFFIRKNKALWVLYFYAVIQFLVLYFTSPQYRFFIPIIIGLGLTIVVVSLHKNYKIIKPIVIFLAILPILPLFFSLDISSFTNNRFMKTTFHSLETKNIIIPNKNSRFNYPSKLIKEGNLEYNSPADDSVFFWITGDLPLPSVNEEQVNWMKKYLKIRPQLRTQQLKDGFYSQTLE